jgi:hypothetical protein
MGGLAAASLGAAVSFALASKAAKRERALSIDRAELQARVAIQGGYS